MPKKQLITEHRVLQLATFAGKIVLTSGGEVYRVEVIIARIGQKFNFKIDCVSTLTFIIVFKYIQRIYNKK